MNRISDKKYFEVYIYSEGYSYPVPDAVKEEPEDLMKIRFEIVKSMLDEFKDLRSLTLNYLLENMLGDE